MARIIIINIIIIKQHQRNYDMEKSDVPTGKKYSFKIHDKCEFQI